MPPQAGCWPPFTVAKMKIEWPHFSWSVLFGLVVNSETEKAEESQIEHGIWGSMDGFIKPPVCIRLKGTDVGLRLLCCGMFHIHLFVATHHDIKTDQFSERLC